MFGAIAAGPPIVALAPRIRAHAVPIAVVRALVLALAGDAREFRGAKTLKCCGGGGGRGFGDNGCRSGLWRGSRRLVGGVAGENRNDELVSGRGGGAGATSLFVRGFLQRLISVDAQAVSRALAALAERTRDTCAVMTTEAVVTGAFSRQVPRLLQPLGHGLRR